MLKILKLLRQRQEKRRGKQKKHKMVDLNPFILVITLNINSLDTPIKINWVKKD